MTDHDDPHPEASPDLATEDPGSDASQPEPSRPATAPPDLDHVVSYGRLVNVLAAVTDRLAEKGHTVTEAQTRIILQSLRNERDGEGNPEDEPYRLTALVRLLGRVVGLEPSLVAAVVEDIVEGSKRR